MKFIQSFWSKPIKDTMVWADSDYLFITWILSSLRLHEKYNRVQLITDAKGKYIFNDILQLPYYSIKEDLDNLDDKLSQIWTWGKLLSYSLQQEPFIHVDGDVIISKVYSFEKERLIAQHKEKEFSHNEALYMLLKNKNYEIPAILSVENAKQVCEYNMGIVGGSEFSFFQEMYAIAKSIIDKNLHRLSATKDIKEITAFNTIVEQNLFCNLAKNKHIKVSTLFKDGYIKDDYVGLVNFRKTNSPDYIHPVGYLKKNPYFGERITGLLFCEKSALLDKYLANRSEILKTLDIESTRSLTVRRRSDAEEVFNGIRRIVLNNGYPLYNRELYLYKLNPYVDLRINPSGEWLVDVPSLLSTPTCIKFVTYKIGVLRGLVKIIIQEFHDTNFSFEQVKKMFGYNLTAEEERKIFIAIQQLKNMNIIEFIGGCRKALNE